MIIFSVRFAGGSFRRWSDNLIKRKVSLVEFFGELNFQKNVFSSKILVMLIVSYEIALFSLLDGGQYQDMVLGSRLVLIVLPFLHFYLSSNISSINSETYLKYVFYNAIGVCAMIVCSPVIVFVLFGEEYIKEGFSLNYYSALIVFQAYMNFIFILALKESFVAVLAKRLILILVVSVLVVLAVHCWIGISGALLLALVVGKVCLAVLLCPGVGVKYRLITLQLFFIPMILNYGLIEVGYFDFVIVLVRFAGDCIWRLI